MKTDLVYRKIFNKNFQGQTLTFESIDSDLIVVIDLLTNERVNIYPTDAEILDEEGNFLFNTVELNKFDSFKDMNVCQECFGDVFVDIGQGDESEIVECECEIPYEL